VQDEQEQVEESKKVEVGGGHEQQPCSSDHSVKARPHALGDHGDGLGLNASSAIIGED